MFNKISDTFIKDLQVGGKLGSILEAVKVNSGLSLQIRDEDVYIYYRGGKVLQIHPEGNNKGDYIFTFNLNYLADDDNSKEAFKIRALFNDASGRVINKKGENKHRNHQYQDIADILPVICIKMDRWWGIDNTKLEVEFEQLIVRENNISKQISMNTDYKVIVTEYGIPGRYVGKINGFSKLDLGLIRYTPADRASKTKEIAELVLTELKYGDNAIVSTEKNPGLYTHLKDMLYLVNSGKRQIVEDFQNIVTQMGELGMMPCLPADAVLSDNIKITLAFIMADHNPEDIRLEHELQTIVNSLEYKELLQKGIAVKLFKSSMMGYGLYARNMISIEEFLLKAV